MAEPEYALATFYRRCSNYHTLFKDFNNHHHCGKSKQLPNSPIAQSLVVEAAQARLVTFDWKPVIIPHFTYR